MKPQHVIEIASKRLAQCVGHPFNQIAIAKPTSAFEALNMLKITSKLSPIIGNLFEIDAVEILTGVKEFKGHGKWIRQDPDFPDVLFTTDEDVQPGFEVKAWYPFSTEITGRFKDSQNRFAEDQTYVCMFAWMPEHLLFGKPTMLDICLYSGRSLVAPDAEPVADFLDGEVADVQRERDCSRDDEGHAARSLSSCPPDGTGISKRISQRSAELVPFPLHE